MYRKKKRKRRRNIFFVFGNARKSLIANSYKGNPEIEGFYAGEF
jgi:hypothetical protein